MPNARLSLPKVVPQGLVNEFREAEKRLEAACCRVVFAPDRAHDERHTNYHDEGCAFRRHAESRLLGRDRLIDQLLIGYHPGDLDWSGSPEHILQSMKHRSYVFTSLFIVLGTFFHDLRRHLARLTPVSAHR